MARFITLAGRKQVGKDTSAQYIQQMLSGQRVHIVHFADALKKACYHIFGIELEDMETETGKQKLTDVRWPRYHTVYVDDGLPQRMWLPDPHGEFMTVREVLQYVGTEMFRTQIDPDTWVKSVFRKKWRDDDIVVIADCRFPNEAEIARENGVLISVSRETGLAADGHASETSLDDYSDYHYTIINDGSFDQLRQKLLQILVDEEILVRA